MKIEIQEEGKEKKMFFTFRDASLFTGIPIPTIWNFLKKSERKNDRFVRRSDKKVFFIREKKDETFIQVDGVNFFDIDEITQQFGLTRTTLINQLIRKKNHFLDQDEISHFVTWKSDDLENILKELREVQMIRNACPKKSKKTKKN